jgi:hypothetical protein
MIEGFVTAKRLVVMIYILNGFIGINIYSRLFFICWNIGIKDRVNRLASKSCVSGSISLQSCGYNIVCCYGLIIRKDLYNGMFIV